MLFCVKLIGRGFNISLFVVVAEVPVGSCASLCLSLVLLLLSSLAALKTIRFLAAVRFEAVGVQWELTLRVPLQDVED
jgi:hypothetical protein